MKTFLEIFVSVFFIFGLYSAVLEAWILAKRIYRSIKAKRRIDKKLKRR